MGWFKDKYGENANPKLPAKDYSRLYDKFGEKAANDTLQDVQEGRISVETLEKYMTTSKKHKSDFELADFCRGGELTDDD